MGYDAKKQAVDNGVDADTFQQHEKVFPDIHCINIHLFMSYLTVLYVILYHVI